MVLESLDGSSEGSTDLEVQRLVPEAPLFAAGNESTPGAGQEGGPQPGDPTPAAEGGTPSSGGEAPVEPSMDQALLEAYDYDRPKHGDIRKGAVVSIEPTEVVVDIGAKRECIIPASDFQKLGAEAVAQIKVGDEISVYIVKPEDREGHLVGSLHLAHVDADWARAEQMEQTGEVFEGRISGQNRGGLLVPFGRLRGFVPASHLIGTNADAADRPLALNQWIGKTLPFKVIEVNRRRNRLILSYRAARRQWRSQQKETLLGQLHEGDVRRGVISSVASFGAFVDLGGADGLIHVSEMAWHRVEHPGEAVQVGQEVEVYVLRVDGERGRIGLSLKRLQPDPWTLVEARYQPGQNVEGRITKLVDFGAFVELERGIEGLIHITELASPTPARAEEVVQPGEVYLLRVLRTDAQNRRIGLSLKSVAPEDLAVWQAQSAAPSTEPEAAQEGDGASTPPDPA